MTLLDHQTCTIIYVLQVGFLGNEELQYWYTASIQGIIVIKQQHNPHTAFL